jgi:hypothetical protein
MSLQSLPGVPVLLDEALTITFNQPMESATLTFVPDVAGSITWANVMTLTFTPDEAWPLGVDYAVIMAALALCSAQNPMPEPTSMQTPK